MSFGGTSSTYWLWMIDSTSVNRRRFSYVAPASLDLLATAPPSDSVNTSSSTEISTPFFICPIRLMSPSPSTICLAARPQPLRRIHRLAPLPHLEVEPGASEGPRIAHRAQHLPLLDVLALGHADLGGV